MKAPLIHVASMLFNEPLAILPQKLEAILQAIGPRLTVDAASLQGVLSVTVPAGVIGSGSDLSLATNGVVSGTSNFSDLQPMMVGDVLVLDAQNGQNGNGEPSKPYRLTPEGVAVIPVRGTLMKRFSYLTSISGFSSYAGLKEAASQAMGDPQVKAVLFDVDSPGGTTHGCFELSDAIYQMRGEKPMWAVANDLAASAAYALASAADRIWLTRTAGVGSVGVFALHMDQSAMDEEAGLKFTYIYAGEKKVDGNPHEPLGRSARADIQAEVDRENDIFIATVARNRGFAGANVTKIRGTKAGVFFADDALSLLADEVGTYEAALGALAEKVNGSKLISSGKVERVAEKAATMPEDPKENTDEARGTAGQAGEPEATKGEQTMPKDAEEMKAKKADEEAAAHAADPNDGDDDDEEEEKDKEAAKGKKAAARGVTEMPTVANSAAKQIADLCVIAGAPELCADYIGRGYSVDKVIEKLSARRTKASAEGTVNSYVAGEGGGADGGGRASVDATIEQARIMSANSGGTLSQSKCMERLLRAHPEVYEGYLEERGRVAAQVAFTGGGRALTQYVLNNQRRYMANLGLGTTIDDVPARRAM